MLVMKRATDQKMTMGPCLPNKGSLRVGLSYKHAEMKKEPNTGMANFGHRDNYCWLTTNLQDR